jgi:hypothetical protein
MLGIDATYGDVSFDRGRNPRRVLLKIVPGAAALALAGSAGYVAGCVGAWILHSRPAAAPDIVNARPAAAPTAAPAAVASNPFGEIIVDPSFLSEIKPASRDGDLSPLASLEAAPPAPFPIPRLEKVPPPPSAAIPLPSLEAVPLPPKRDVPEIADTAPLPPPRPPEFGLPAAPDRRLARQNVAPAPTPADNRNFFQKLFGWGLPSWPAVAPRPAAASAPAVAGKAPEGRLAYAAPESRAAYAAPQGRVPGNTIFGAPAPVAGFDRWTAVYDISARTLYLPDGTRLEAHSGLGDRLDDPRYVSERMRGATPPNVYELEPREASFHGVQALRLTPVGDAPLFGRAGLLAHPYMLGPNGDSNGCVSVKDYEAFLRAYQNGQVKRLAVVARL